MEVPVGVSVVRPYPFTFEYCQSALSSVRIETPASAETPRKNRVYSIHTRKSMAGGVVTPRDHNALTSTIGYRALSQKCRMTDAVGQSTPSRRRSTSAVCD